MAFFFLQFVLWHWMYFLFGALIFLILLLFFLVNLVELAGAKRKRGAVKRAAVAAAVSLVLLLLLVCAAVLAFSAYMMEYYPDVWQNHRGILLSLAAPRAEMGGGAVGVCRPPTSP